MRAACVAIVTIALAVAGCSDARKTEAARVTAEAGPAQAPTRSELVAPEPLAPADGSEFNQFPRKTTVRWSPVAGATAYKVDVEYQTPETGEWLPMTATKETKSTEYQFEFAGSQPGRWRAWAVDGAGRVGPKSDWWTFRYTR